MREALQKGRRAPGGPARRADILPQEQRFQPTLGRLEIMDGIFTRSAQVPNRFIFHRRDIDRGQGPRAHPPGQLDRVTPVRFDPIAGLFGEQRGGHHPAALAFLGHITVAPVPTGPGLIDKDELRAFGLQPTDELIDVTLACADAAEGDDLSTVISVNGGNGNRLFVDIKTDGECARLVHG
jgi:hypothetical protein